MTAQELIETKAIKWIIEKSNPQTDFDGKDIPNSAHFTGNLPPRMAKEIKKAFKKAGSNVRDAGKSTVFSLSSGDTEKDFSVSASFGVTKSTQNRIKFNLTPFTW